VTRRGRRIGCLTFAFGWLLLLQLTILLFALGDCNRDSETGACIGQPANLERIVFGAEFLLLVVAGWIFYRAEMKDSEF
jgi:hypothetical protein